MSLEIIAAFKKLVNCVNVLMIYYLFTKLLKQDVSDKLRITAPVSEDTVNNAYDDNDFEVKIKFWNEYIDFTSNNLI